MKRTFEETLLSWKKAGMNKPFMLIGARQIGKTYLVKKFCKENFENYFFDFEVDESGEMHFDYKLKKGVSNNMNASILLKNVLND